MIWKKTLANFLELWNVNIFLNPSQKMTRLEFPCPLSPPQQGPLEKNMPTPIDGHFNYRLIQRGYLYTVKKSIKKYIILLNSNSKKLWNSKLYDTDIE